MHHILVEFTLINYAIWKVDYATALSEMLHKFTFIVAPKVICINTFTMEHSCLPLALIRAAIRHRQKAITMFLALLKLSLIDIAIRMINPLTMLFAIQPLSFISVASG